VTTALPVGRIAITIDLHVNFLSPADGESLIAKATAIQVGKSVSVATVEVITETAGKERLCSVATVTLRAVDAPANSDAGGPRN
jgi:uncharacterized protein (TIGR00369 family)